MAYLLLIDTSTDAGLLALCHDGRLLGSQRSLEARNHAASINLLIESLLAEAGLEIGQLSAVAVNAGPGSYTGLRIGLATAKGICFALDIPLIASNRLDLLVLTAFNNRTYQYEWYASILLAREKEYFVSLYDAACKIVSPPQHISEEMLEVLFKNKEKLCLVSDIPDSVISTLPVSFFHLSQDAHINLETWCQEAFQKYVRNDIVNFSAFEPFYLKQVYTHK